MKIQYLLPKRRKSQAKVSKFIFVSQKFSELFITQKISENTHFAQSERVDYKFSIKLSKAANCARRFFTRIINVNVHINDIMQPLFGEKSWICF